METRNETHKKSGFPGIIIINIILYNGDIIYYVCGFQYPVGVIGTLENMFPPRLVFLNSTHQHLIGGGGMIM